MSRKRRADQANVEPITESSPDVITLPNSGLRMASVEDGTDELSREQIQSIMSIVNEDDNEGGERNTGGADEEHTTQHYPDDSSATIFVTDTGLQLTDCQGQEFFFSTQQLMDAGVDVRSLSDQGISRVLSLAVPSGARLGKGEMKMKISEHRSPQHEAPIPKREKLSQVQVEPSKNGQSTTFSNPDTQYPSSSSGSGLQPQQLIGEQVEVRKDGKLVPATVRYVRVGAGFKVQFEDGHFEWVDEEDVTLKPGHRGDHEGYSGGVVTKRAHQDSFGQHKASSTQENPAPNFCCPICARKVHQAQPSFIVIRVPACDDCTREKVVVLDEQFH